MVFAPRTQTGRRLPAQASPEMKSHCLGGVDIGILRLHPRRRQKMFQPSLRELIKFGIQQQGSVVHSVIGQQGKWYPQSKTAFHPAYFFDKGYLTARDTVSAFWNDEKANKVALVRRGTMIKPRPDSEAARGVDFRSAGYLGFKNIKSPPVTLPRVPVRILN